MKVKKVLTLLMLCALVAVFASAAYAQDDKPVIIATVLSDAKCPLSKEQVTLFKTFTSRGGPATFRPMFDMFNEKQNVALKDTFGIEPESNGRPETPRFLFLAIIFENEGCPYTESQIEKMKIFPFDREVFGRLMEIHTEAQGKVLAIMYPR